MVWEWQEVELAGTTAEDVQPADGVGMAGGGAGWHDALARVPASVLSQARAGLSAIRAAGGGRTQPCACGATTHCRFEKDAAAACRFEGERAGKPVVPRA